MEVQATRSRNCKKAMYAVLGNRSVTEDVLSTTMCIVEQTLNARLLTHVSSDVNEALTPNHFLPYLPQKNLVTNESSFDKLKHMHISYGTNFGKNICQL